MFRLKFGGALLGTAILVGSGIIVATPGVASATPADCKTNGTACLTAVGSNTTEELMDYVAADFNLTNGNGTGNQLTNIHSLPAAPVTAPSDANCPIPGPQADQTYSQAPVPPGDRLAPNGSGAGKTALAASVTNGDSCVSIARSSSAPATTDPAGTEAWAFAVDAVDWVASGTNAPTNLTMTQLQGIYDCTFTNWNQVGSTHNKAIVRYYPQAGSGSGDFFNKVLGFDARTPGGMNACTTAPTLIEENEATSVTAADKPGAIMIYSTGAYIAQGNNITTPDKRNGFTVRKINNFAYVSGTAPALKLSTTTVSNANVEPATYHVGDNTVVQGVRHLYNFLNNPGSVDYTAAKGAVGPGSRLCLNDLSAAIKTFGFGPLPVVGGSACVLATPTMP